MATRTFDSPPAGAPLMLKAALPAIPVVGKLPGIRHERGGLPDTTLVRRGVTTDPAHVARYREVCGFPLSPALPVTYPHLAAHTLHLTLMTDTSFPFTPMGAVHLRNRITQHRPIAPEETYDLSLRAAALTPHPKGQLVELLSEARVGDDLVWDESMTVFFRGSSGSGPEPTTPPLEGVEAPTGPVHWKLPGNLGRTYGAVSGDRNPIHLYPLTAKAFGFPRNIAHGMWTKAKCLAALSPRLPDAYTVTVEFKKPIVLPNTVVFGQEQQGDRMVFGVRGARKPVPHLVGTIEPH
ncbi:hypothetical protein D9V41_12240 [Aeromicrobium phragmitis]|uniref:MaoC-like domain-containing protein n=1 Tax=Aeromicrobium phragmitis TaxID=2478914 RepID=A0A3L8PMJ2_9ACTN|nr:MaoC/PaaZ C-terminal domain-containing protein [Aeromicrobium phragmitis]RLV55262.1 hypothetical protein D9V41_12240 [Aeromicrobium phragmitis]